MQTGLLWYDSDPNRGLTAKIEDAARRYREKFGQTADTCYISNRAVTNAGMQQALSGPAVRVIPSKTIGRITSGSGETKHRRPRSRRDKCGVPQLPDHQLSE